MYQESKKPENFIVWAILTTVFCCIPTGIVAIVYANKVDTLWYEGKKQNAIECSRNAKMWTFISLGVGFACQICLFFIFLIAGLS